jgi:hypothetical protein
MIAGPLFIPNPIRTLLAAAITIPLLSCQDQITATPGGGQPNAFQLEAIFNRVTVVGSAGDSVQLTQATTGASQLVINAGGQSLDIYGNGTDTLDTHGPGAPETLAAGSWVWFYCLTPGQWQSTSPGSGGGGGGITAPVIFPGRVVMASGTIVMTNADYYLGVDKTIAAPTTVTLPAAPSPFQQVVIDDVKGDAATNNITIQAGVSTVYTIDVGGQNVALMWNGLSWRTVG